MIWRDQEANNRSDSLWVWSGFVIKCVNQVPRRGPTPSDRVVAGDSDIALHSSSLSSIASHGAVSLSRAIRPLDYIVVLVEALAIARRPLWVVGKSVTIKELQELRQRLR